jgi:hypothetical protein
MQKRPHEKAALAGAALLQQEPHHMTSEPELTLERDAPPPPLDTAAKRALIESELRTDASRSDREIARAVGNGICHKTVGVARERLGLASPLGNSPPTSTEQRHMLIEGCKDFDKIYPPGPSEVERAEEAVDNAIAVGKIAPAGTGGGDAAAARLDITVQAAVDQVHGAVARMRDDRQAQADSEGEKNQERTVLGPRKEVTIQHDDEMANGSSGSGIGRTRTGLSSSTMRIFTGSSTSSPITSVTGARHDRVASSGREGPPRAGKSHCRHGAVVAPQAQRDRAPRPPGEGGQGAAPAQAGSRGSGRGKTIGCGRTAVNDGQAAPQ